MTAARANPPADGPTPYARRRQSRKRNGRSGAAYRLFLLASAECRGAVGRAVSVHGDAEAFDLHEIADLFARLRTAELAGAWNGVIVDSFERRPDSWRAPGALGELARALSVVAVRLGHPDLVSIDAPLDSHTLEPENAA